MSDKKQSMTVFKSDRHEDVGAIFLAGLTVIVVLAYMAFVVPEVVIKANLNGKIATVETAPGAILKKGDVIYTIEVVEKKWVDNKLQEKTVVKKETVKANGKVLKVAAKPGDKVSKGKDVILVLDHEKGTLP